jgi:hypothetical protein
VSLLQAIAALEQELEQSVKQGASRQIDFVNCLMVGSATTRLERDPTDDLIYLNVTMKGIDGKLRALLDSGASISGISASVANEWADALEAFKAPDEPARTVFFANGKKGETGGAYSALKFREFSSGTTVAVQTAFELPMPPGVDIILGRDWFREAQPEIDWTDGSVTLSKKASITGRTTAIGQVEKARLAAQGRISRKQMDGEKELRQNTQTDAERGWCCLVRAAWLLCVSKNARNAEQRGYRP